MSSQERLSEVASELSKGKPVPSVTVRELLGWFNAQRRGYWIVQIIRTALEKAGLTTEPDFEAAYIDSPLRFLPRPAEKAAEPEAPKPAQLGEAAAPIATSSATPVYAYGDPTYRISKLAAANNTPVTVAPTSTLQEAVTIMLSRDFSQLPVMVGERDVKGIISWSSIGGRLALGKGGDSAQDYMEPRFGGGELTLAGAHAA